MAWKIGGKTEVDGADWTGFLDKGVQLDGTLEVAGTFRIDCKMKGTLIGQQSILIGENAQIEGQIEGNHVVVGGRFDGTIRAKGRVEIQPKGIVTGEVHTPCLVIEAGGILDGRCHMGNTAEETKPLTIPMRPATQQA